MSGVFHGQLVCKVPQRDAVLSHLFKPILIKTLKVAMEIMLAKSMGLFIFKICPVRDVVEKMCVNEDGALSVCRPGSFPPNSPFCPFQCISSYVAIVF